MAWVTKSIGIDDHRVGADCTVRQCTVCRGTGAGLRRSTVGAGS